MVAEFYMGVSLERTTSKTHCPFSLALEVTHHSSGTLSPVESNHERSVLCCPLVARSCPTLCDPMDCSPPASSVLGDSPGKNTGGHGLPCPPPGDLPKPGIKPRSPTLQADSLPSEPPGNPKNTRVGSLYLLQGIFPTQQSNWGLLH